MPSATSTTSVLRQDGRSRCTIPTTTRKVIAIESDDESSDTKRNHGLSPRHLAFRSARDHETVASLPTNGVARTVQRAVTKSSHQGAFKMPTTNKADQKAHYLPVPAVKEYLMEPLYSSSPAALGSAKTPKTVLAVKDRSLSGARSRDAGQKMLETYFQPVTPQPSKSSSTIAPPTSTKPTPSLASTALRKHDDLVSSKRPIPSSPVEPKQLETPRHRAPQPNNSQLITPNDRGTSSASKFLPVRVKQEPGVSSHNSSKFKNALPPRTPPRPAVNSNVYVPSSVPSSAGTSFHDPYDISSDSGSGDDDTLNGNEGFRGVRSFSEINSSGTGQNAAAGVHNDELAPSSPWTENFRERELSVEAVLRECQGILLDDSPIPFSITTGTGTTSERQARTERSRNNRAQQDSSSRTRAREQTQDGHRDGDDGSCRKRPCLRRDRDNDGKLAVPATPSPLKKRTVSFAPVVIGDDDKPLEIHNDNRKNRNKDKDKRVQTSSNTHKQTAHVKTEYDHATTAVSADKLLKGEEIWIQEPERKEQPESRSQLHGDRDSDKKKMLKRMTRHRNRDRAAWNLKKKPNKRQRRRERERRRREELKLFKSMEKEGL